MALLYLYAIVDDDLPEQDIGVAGEELVSVRFDGGAIIGGAVDAVPRVDVTVLRAQDALIRRLASRFDAILPMRFGTSVPTETALQQILTGRTTQLQHALKQVAGREQMTLRVFSGARNEPVAVSSEAARDLDEGATGEGTRYLRVRAREHTARQEVSELEPLLRLLTGYVREQRADRHNASPLLTTVYHLIDRGAAAEYTHVINANAQLLAPVTVRVTGPCAPYAFADGILL